MRQTDVGFRAIAIFFIAIVVATTACNTSSDEVQPPSTEGAAETPGAQATSAGSAQRYDYEGQRYDFGTLEGSREIEGARVIEFDRYQVYIGDKLLSGKQFTEEPLVYGNTDVPWVNNDKTLRQFRLAANAEFLAINRDELRSYCRSLDENPDEEPPRVTWQKVDFGAFKALDLIVVSLTFGSDGYVTRIRQLDGC